MEDMSGVYVTFNQGVTEPKKTHGATSGLQLLRETATDLRRHCGDLERHGFRLDSEIDLRTEGTLGRDYEAATIAYKFYERGSVPDDPEIAQDLEALLTMYDQQINTPPDAKAPLDDVESRPIPPSPPYTMPGALADLFLEEDEIAELLTLWRARRTF
jgi:MrcB-like, N-terminal domain